VHRAHDQIGGRRQPPMLQTKPPRDQRHASVSLAFHPLVLVVMLSNRSAGGWKLDHRGHGHVRRDPFGIHAHALGLGAEDLSAISPGFVVARGLGQGLQETCPRDLGPERFPQLERARRVTQDLHGLDPGEVVEEPAATRVHEHELVLHLEQGQDPLLLGAVERSQRVLLEERIARLGPEKQLHVVVPCRPRISQQPSRLRLDVLWVVLGKFF
jgi:hypothetical protein